MKRTRVGNFAGRVAAHTPLRIGSSEGEMHDSPVETQLHLTASRSAGLVQFQSPETTVLEFTQNEAALERYLLDTALRIQGAIEADNAHAAVAEDADGVITYKMNAASTAKLCMTGTWMVTGVLPATRKDGSTAGKHTAVETVAQFASPATPTERAALGIASTPEDALLWNAVFGTNPSMFTQFLHRFAHPGTIFSPLTSTDRAFQAYMHALDEAGSAVRASEIVTPTESVFLQFGTRPFNILGFTRDFAAGPITNVILGSPELIYTPEYQLPLMNERGEVFRVRHMRENAVVFYIPADAGFFDLCA